MVESFDLDKEMREWKVFDNDRKRRRLDIEKLKVIDSMIESGDSWKRLVMLDVMYYVLSLIESNDLDVDSFKDYFDDCLEMSMDW